MITGGPKEHTAVGPGSFGPPWITIEPDAARLRYGGLVDPTRHIGDYPIYDVNFMWGVPEPGAWALKLAGLALVGSAVRRRRASEAAGREIGRAVSLVFGARSNGRLVGDGGSCARPGRSLRAAAAWRR